MTKKSSYFLGIALTIGIGMLLYHFFCCNSDCCRKDNMVTGTNSEITNTSSGGVFALKGKDLDYHCNDNFNFLNSDFKSLEPIADSINIGIEQLKASLQKNKQQLTITGYCLSSEKNTSAYENLGVSRAISVKNYLVSRGIPSNIITTKGEIKDDGIVQKENTLFGPVNFDLNEVVAESKAEDFNALKDSINANPLILYFNTGQASIDLSIEDRKKVASIVRYLDNVPTGKLDAIGFTDNVGNAATNVKLGQERADFAKAYLVSNGISTERINSTSKGPENPIADNKTPKGRAKNRRTEIKIN